MSRTAASVTMSAMPDADAPIPPDRPAGPDRPDGPDRPGPRRARARTGWLVAVAAVGLVLVAVGWRSVTVMHSFGWFAYAPLSDAQTSPVPVGFFRRGLFCLPAGALLLGAVGGYLLGRRAIRDR